MKGEVGNSWKSSEAVQIKVTIQQISTQGGVSWGLSGTGEAETAVCCHSPVMGRDLGGVTHL